MTVTALLWRAVYTPGDRQTSRMYCTTLVQYLYISCYVFSNKLVLSYLFLRLLLHYSNNATLHFCIIAQRFNTVEKSFCYRFLKLSL